MPHLSDSGGEPILISTESIAKSYRLGTTIEPYKTLRDVVARGIRRSWSPRQTHASVNPSRDILWALRDLTFEVHAGEVVGVVGRNGAGKSTLLKILSRITAPTSGRVALRGRVSSLLEIGTGFHPELTGRENIYLNGSILGMTRREIAAKFAEIVEFAELHRFIDTPVKRYSSGMYVRLAFSVAAHLDTEILLVDEVLAVGDVQFQKKCLSRMGALGVEGRTVIFVSHAMAAVQSLCSRGLVLESGRLVFDGHIDEAIRRYVSGAQPAESVQSLDSIKHSGSGPLRLRRFWLEDDQGGVISSVRNGQQARFVIAFDADDGSFLNQEVEVNLMVKSTLGIRVFYHHNLLSADTLRVSVREGQFCLTLPRLPLSQGPYVADVHVTLHGGRTLIDGVDDAVSFDVIDGDFFGTGAAYSGQAAIMVDGSWEVRAGASPQ